jgi:AAA15 family ATPase/GTPase
MANDLDKPTETSEQKAKRMWLNQKIRQEYKAGNTLVPMMVNPKDIDYVNGKVRLDKNPPPDVATVIENDKKPRAFYGFERKFLKEVRSILDERKQANFEIIRAGIRHERRKLMLEKIRRLELSIARNQAILAQRHKNAEEGQLDLFAALSESKDLFA